jgi:hypothetical protein
MFTKKKYNSTIFSFTVGFSGFNFGQIENNLFPGIDEHSLILAGIIIGAIVIFNFVYQHIKDRKLNSSKPKNYFKK